MNVKSLWTSHIQIHVLEGWMYIVLHCKYLRPPLSYSNLVIPPPLFGWDGNLPLFFTAWWAIQISALLIYLYNLDERLQLVNMKLEV